MPKIDILHAFENKPVEPDFVIPGFLVGTVGALVAPGSTGKSMFALQLACAVASNEITANTTGLTINRHGQVLYLNLEDPPSELQRRLHALGSQFNIRTRESIAENLRISARMGILTNIMDDKFMTGLLKAAEGTRLVILDTLSRVHQLDENDNGAMSQIIGRLEKVVRQTGAALLYLHHTSKSVLLDGAQAARGASALIDNARWCCKLLKMTTNETEKLQEVSGLKINEQRRNFFVKYEVVKQNYGEIENIYWYERTDGGILKKVELKDIATKKTATKKGEWK